MTMERDVTDRIVAVLKGRRILLVDDSSLNRLIGTSLINRLGCQVDTAEHGQAALTAVARASYDIVLMDCEMPEMDGYEATTAIRSLEARQGGTQHLPIIAVTANTDAWSRHRCLAVGMDDVMPKPYRNEQLIHTLLRWLTADHAGTMGD